MPVSYSTTWAAVGIFGVSPETLEIIFFGQHPAVQISAHRSRHPGVVAGVDEIRADFKRGDVEPASGQGRNQPYGHGGFAAAAFGAGNDKSFDVVPLFF